MRCLKSVLMVALTTMLVPATVLAVACPPDEPDGHHSGLVTHDDDVVWDNELAAMIEDNFGGWKHMKFAFGQCYSGGFIDDISGLGDRIVISTSSCWDTPAHYDGQTGDSYMRWWTNAVDDTAGSYASTAPPEPVMASMKEAYDWGKLHPKVDLDAPQYLSKPKGFGDELHLKHDEVERYALVWAGNVEDNPYTPLNETQAFLDDAKHIYDSLTGLYDYTDDNIHVLFGGGPADFPGETWIDDEATCETMEQHIQEFGPEVDAEDQFFGWFFDHGTETKDWDKQELRLAWVPNPWDDDGWPDDDPRPVRECMDVRLFAHVAWPGREGETFTIEDTSFPDHIEGGNVDDIRMLAAAGQEHKICEWFPWADVHIADNPECTIIRFRADLDAEEFPETLWSNRVPAHVLAVADEDKDFGDAPDSYRTRLKDDGPRYADGVLQRLGEQWDAELDGQPTPCAFGDDINLWGVGGPDDEDGVQFSSDSVTVTVNVGRPGDYQLRAWWDLDWSDEFDAWEMQIDQLLTLTAGEHEKTYGLWFDPRYYYSRFRLTWLDDPVGWMQTDPITGLPIGGPTLDVTPWGEFVSIHNGVSYGEVEDYHGGPGGPTPFGPQLPEPATLLLLAAGLAGCLRRRR